MGDRDDEEVSDYQKTRVFFLGNVFFKCEGRMWNEPT